MLCLLPPALEQAVDRLNEDLREDTDRLLPEYYCLDIHGAQQIEETEDGIVYFPSSTASKKRCRPPNPSHPTSSPAAAYAIEGEKRRKGMVGEESTTKEDADDDSSLASTNSEMADDHSDATPGHLVTAASSTQDHTPCQNSRRSSPHHRANSTPIQVDNVWT